MLPPFQTPHSANAPGMSLATTCSTPSISAASRCGEVIVWRRTRTIVSATASSKSDGSGGGRTWLARATQPRASMRGLRVRVRSGPGMRAGTLEPDRVAGDVAARVAHAPLPARAVLVAARRVEAAAVDDHVRMAGVRVDRDP